MARAKTVDPDLVTPEVGLEKVRRAFLEYGVDYGPEFDDITARAINRMGGWIGFCGRVMAAKNNDQALEQIKQDFAEHFNEFKQNKLNGQYQEDHLPTMFGTDGERTAFRLLFKQKQPT